MSTSVLAHLPTEAVGQSLKHKSISRRALGPGSDCHHSDEGRESPVLSTCRVRSGNGSWSPQTTLEGEDGGDAGGFAQGTCVRLGVSFQEAAAADGASFTSQTRCWGFRGGLGLVKSGSGTGMGPLPSGTGFP